MDFVGTTSVHAGQQFCGICKTAQKFSSEASDFENELHMLSSSGSKHRHIYYCLEALSCNCNFHNQSHGKFEVNNFI